MDEQVVSKQRVADHGEVYTGEREVNAMLDLVKPETKRIDSKFLEPACGTSNFVTEILRRKLRVVDSRYRRSQLDWERNAVTAVFSIYGIDILPDNVVECRRRLFEIFDEAYSAHFKRKAKEECRNVVRFILEQNIICGDALTLKTVGQTAQPIEFTEWTFVKGSFINRRVYAFHELMPSAKSEEFSLFEEPQVAQVSDLGHEAFIPMPVRSYPLIHFLKVAEIENQSAEPDFELR